MREEWVVPSGIGRAYAHRLPLRPGQPEPERVPFREQLCGPLVMSDPAGRDAEIVPNPDDMARHLRVVGTSWQLPVAGHVPEADQAPCPSSPVARCGSGTHCAFAGVGSLICAAKPTLTKGKSEDRIPLDGGGCGIRTHGDIAATLVFKTNAFGR